MKRRDFLKLSGIAPLATLSSDDLSSDVSTALGDEVKHYKLTLSHKWKEGEGCTTRAYLFAWMRRSAKRKMVKLQFKQTPLRITRPFLGLSGVFLVDDVSDKYAEPIILVEFKTINMFSGQDFQ